MRAAPLAATLLCCLPPLAAAAPRGDEAAARAALVARFDAVLRGDTEALEELLADDLEYCNVRGVCSDKRQYLHDVASGRRAFRSLTPSITRVKLLADIAVLSGTVSAVAVRDGVEQSIDAAFLAILVRRDGRWQLTNQSSTALEPSGK
jgi:ketosteroid isomerase-like protein